MRTAAVLPVKRFAYAKQRLVGDLDAATRRALARAMVADVLDALGACTAVEQTILVTREPSMLEHAGANTLLLSDEAEAGQSAAVALGVARALAEGMQRVLCVPGDCPALDPSELDRLLLAHGNERSPAVVIVPDRHGSGTNGLLLSPPDAIEPSFGPDSCARHLQGAAAAGARCLVERPPSLLLDIDTSADLVALRRRLAQAPAGAVRTRALLGRSAPRDALALSAGD